MLDVGAIVAPTSKGCFLCFNSSEDDRLLSWHPMALFAVKSELAIIVNIVRHNCKLLIPGRGLFWTLLSFVQETKT